jgi:transcriptional regulator with XRE-family HTH domain
MDTQYYVEQGIKSSISDRIALLRTEVLKMNQKDFAELVGLSQSTLSQYEGGKMLPSIMTALTIAMKCNVSLDWLCGRDEIHLSNLANVMACFFELYEIEQFKIETEIHNKVDMEDNNETDEEKRNWVAFKVFYNDFWHDKKYKYSVDICNIIEKAYSLTQDWKSFRLSQDRYDQEKMKWIESYKNSLITKDDDHSSLSEDEQNRRRIEIMRAELEAMEKKNKG